MLATGSLADVVRQLCDEFSFIYLFRACVSAHSAVCAARRNQSDRLVIHQRLRCVKILLLNFGLERHAKHLCRPSFLYALVPGNQISLYMFVYLFKVILSNSSPGFCSFFFL